MWREDVDDSEFIIGGLVYPHKAYIKELPTGWKPRCKTYGECKKGKTMDSAKKSVEKILEIAKKHGYSCVVAFKKGDDAYAGVCDEDIDSKVIQFSKAFAEALEVCKNGE